MLKLITLTILAGLLFIDATIYATRVPGKTDCLIVYTKSQANTGTIYKFPEGYHIEANRVPNLAEFEVGTANGCIMYSNTIISSLWNTQACYAFKVFNKI